MAFSKAMQRHFFLFLLFLINSTVTGFLNQNPKALNDRDRSACRGLFGICEWRDLMFNFPGTGDDRRLGSERGAPPKEVNILPFPFDQVLLQGEAKQLRLYEDRFIQLFDDTMEKHCGTVAMGLLAESGIIQTVPLCEIEAYNRMNEFGIFVSIRAVGRARLIEITQQEPYIKAVCMEISDKIPPNLELPNLLAGNIGEIMVSLSAMEHRLQKAQEENGDQGLLEGNSEMQRRINVAKLEDRFYHDEDADDDNDDEEVNLDPDRRKRFQQAYKVALETDFQGYSVVSQNFTDYTPQEMTAISWAAFCTEILPEFDATFRIQALDCDNLFERLKLALHMLRTKENHLKEKLKKAGLPLRGEEDDETER